VRLSASKRSCNRQSRFNLYGNNKTNESLVLGPQGCPVKVILEQDVFAVLKSIWQAYRYRSYKQNAIETFYHVFMMAIGKT